MPRTHFGTDGIRGRVGVAPMTPDFVLRLGWAIGRVLGRDHPQPRILIGKDTRQSGYMFESALEAGLSAAGIHVVLLGPQPTPAVAQLTCDLGACAGIVVSASHNPHYDNGIKLFAADGAKLPDDAEARIEAELDRPMDIRPEALPGKARRLGDAGRRYVDFCIGTAAGLRLDGLHLALDCAHGAAYRVAPELFEQLGAKVSAVGIEPNGTNINDGCGATCPERIRTHARACGADLGLAVDGDGDRLIMVDEQGALVDGDDLLYVMAQARRRQGALSGGVAGTLMSNLGLEQALADLGIPFERAAVGDRYVLERLRERGWQLGGETSGHLICLDRARTGDAMVAALHALEALQVLDRPLHQARAELHKHPQVMINVRCPNGNALSAQAEDAAQAARRELGTRGRVVLRPSGTEPVLRVMVEGEEHAQALRLAQGIADSIAPNT